MQKLNSDRYTLYGIIVILFSLIGYLLYQNSKPAPVPPKPEPIQV